jgi:hypothetical protein
LKSGCAQLIRINAHAYSRAAAIHQIRRERLDGKQEARGRAQLENSFRPRRIQVGRRIQPDAVDQPPPQK